MILVFKEPSSRASLAEAKHLLTESKTLKSTGGFPLLSDIPKRSSNFYLFLLQLTLNKLAKINFRERERFFFFFGEKCVFSDVGFSEKGRWRPKMVTPL
ncbi:hypothetical protein AMTRI_Chr06g198590 [Amborella trichopoda]